MFVRIRIVLLIVSCCAGVIAASAQAPPCPGFNPGNNTNLACEIPTVTRNSTSVQNQSLSSLSPTFAAQLSQLPTATVISGSGLTFSRSLGVFTASSDSLGTILTQRGETIGRHKFFISFNYQRFGFNSVDGISLKHLNTVNEFSNVPCVIGGKVSTCQDFVQGNNRIDLLVDQFATIGSFGLTNRVDVSVMVPFSKVTLKTGSSGTEFDVNGNQTASHSLTNTFLAGSATGLGDVSVSVKANVVRGEHVKVAVGGEMRFPTGDESNYLGTGAYGVKPYLVISRSGKITPNINLGYQWNSSSSLFINPSTGAQQGLPSAFMYSGGVDYAVLRRLTLSGEFLGQAVINGPRLASTTQSIGSGSGAVGTFNSVATVSETYAMDNVGIGFKANLFKGLVITGNALFKLDDGGLRSKVIPLIGVSYKFN